ncbi:MAG TPA: LLM class flavin-dependent oxidoreductase [Alphaproteobacteria bacterium]|nr:LLM class flavin-dependent oxidoreductase [Alphaproteobacteria bacterium]
MEFFLFLPQMRLSFERMVAQARAAEAAGFVGMAGMDHLVPPGADAQPMYQATVTSTWIAAHTTRLKVGSLVQCDAFRHPAVLAREAVSLDHASGGRFELGIGWGSYQIDFDRFGLAPATPPERVARLRETLEVLRALWAGETLDYDGRYHHLKGAMQAPRPLGRIPIVIGGAGPKTLALVREFADWCNLDLRHLDKYSGEKFEQVRAQIGKARVSIQEMAAYVPAGGDRKAIAELATKRFGHTQPVIGTGPELLDHYARLAERGIERIYVWFCDFAPPETLAAFGAEVIGRMG